MKRINIYFFVIFLFFIFLNYSNISNFFYNVSGNYQKSKNLEGWYNLGNRYYEDGLYEKAISSFSGILEEDNSLELNFRTLHNLGNSYYKAYDLEKSIESYQNVLLLKSDLETSKNLEFVSEKLRERQNSSSKNSSQEGSKSSSNENSNSSESQNNTQNSQEKTQSSSDESNTQSPQPDLTPSPSPGEPHPQLSPNEPNPQPLSLEERGGEQDGFGNSQEQDSSQSGQPTSDSKFEENDNLDERLNEGLKNALEEKLRDLEQEQRNIGNFYNKDFNQNTDFFNGFFDNPFFDNSILESGEEKDW